jgi:hypothetical protein
MSNTSKTDWSKIDAMIDEDIDTSNIPPLSEEFFAKAKLRLPQTPDNIVAFCPLEETKQRVADLICREKTTGLTQDELSELSHYMQLEHLMRLAKAHARKFLTI